VPRGDIFSPHPRGVTACPVARGETLGVICWPIERGGDFGVIC